MNLQQNEKVEYLFLARTKQTDAFVIKIIGELLSNIVKSAPFTVNEKGIFLTQRDLKNEQLIEIFLNGDDFHSFYCKQPISFLVNSMMFYKMLKSIRKKDTITIFVSKDEPLKLGITVEQENEKNKITTYIKISYNNPEEIQLGSICNYGSPLIINSKEFQKMKNLHSISKKIRLNTSAGQLRFYCNGGEICERYLTMDTEKEIVNDQLPNDYEQTYNTESITQLTKCAGQSGNTIKMFIQKDLPLKIKMRAGNLGDLIIYIKSDEILELESNEDNTQEEDSK
jgi:hypothetical protein